MNNWTRTPPTRSGIFDHRNLENAKGRAPIPERVMFVGYVNWTEDPERGQGKTPMPLGSGKLRACRLEHPMTTDAMTVQEWGGEWRPLDGAAVSSAAQGENHGRSERDHRDQQLAERTRERMDGAADAADHGGSDRGAASVARGVPVGQLDRLPPLRMDGAPGGGAKTVDPDAAGVAQVEATSKALCEFCEQDVLQGTQCWNIGQSIYCEPADGEAVTNEWKAEQPITNAPRSISEPTAGVSASDGETIRQAHSHGAGDDIN